MYCLPEGKLRQKWWSWVVVTPEMTVFLLEPTRSGQVPRDFFPKGTEGIVNVDRYAAYFGLLGSDWKIKLAYCWARQGDLQAAGFSRTASVLRLLAVATATTAITSSVALLEP
jgi:hypothetical protein